MPTKIDPEIKPTQQSLDNLQRHGISEDFVNWELQNFIDYWVTAWDEAETPAQKRDAKKKSWQVALQNWMKSGFQGSAGKRYEEIRHLRRDTGKQQGDIFTPILERMGQNTQPQNLHDPIQRTQFPTVQHSPIPGEGKTMSFEEASEQLRKFII